MRGKTAIILCLGLLFSLAALSIAQTERNSESDGQANYTVRGFVTDSLGRSRGNVYIAPLSTNIWNGVKSDPEGRFTLENVKPGRKNWIAFSQASQAIGLFSIPDDYAGQPVHVILSFNEANVEGRVVGPDGKGLVDRKVELLIKTNQGLNYRFPCTNTDQYGNYISDIIPCGSGLSIQARLTDANEAEQQYVTEPYTLSDDGIFIQMPLLVIGEGQLVETDDGKVLYSGRVVSEQGEPIKSVRVTMMYKWQNSMGYWHMEVMTDEDGRWRRRLPKEISNLSISVLHPEYIRQSWRGVSTAELLEGTNVMVMKRGLSIRGIIKNQNGEPVENALIDTGGSRSSTAEGELIENCTTPRTLADGSFRVGGLAPVSIDIVVTAVGYAPQVVPVDVVENMEPIEAVLKSGRTYLGQVVDENAEPIEGVKIDVSDWTVGNDRHSVPRITQTDSQGNFKIEDLPDEGKVELDFGKRRSGLLGFSKEIPEDVSKIDRIVMYKVPVFIGKVIDAETEKPVTVFTLTNGLKRDVIGESIRWSRGYKRQVNSKDGTFSVPWEGYHISYPFNAFCCLRVEADGYLSEAVPLLEIGKEYEPCIIRLQKAEPLRGIVVDKNGNPALEAEVGWIDPEEKAFIRKGKFDMAGLAYQTDVIVKTDSAGRFDLPPGRDKGLIVVVHESGYGFLTSDDFKGGSRIQLTQWSKIEGTIVSDKTGNEEYVLGISQVTIPEESESQSIRWLFDRTAFSGKEFTINFVPSVPLQIGQIVESGLANTVNIDPKPGQTYKIRFGDKGVVSAEKEQPSLTGKALPELDGFKTNVTSEQSANNGLLICFFDMNQRPSQNCLLQLSKRSQELNSKDVVVIGIQASEVDENSLNEWIKSSGVSFPVGIIETNIDEVKLKWGVKGLPWLVLTDKNHIVSSEGFSVTELDNKIQSAQE